MLTVEASKSDHRKQLLEKAMIKKSPYIQLFLLTNTLVTTLIFSALKQNMIFTLYVKCFSDL